MGRIIVEFKELFALLISEIDSFELEDRKKI